LSDVKGRTLSKQLTDGGKVVSPTPQKHYFFASGTHFCWRLNGPEALVRLEGLGKLEKLIYLI
jgi:hypothetical protein